MSNIFERQEMQQCGYCHKAFVGIEKFEGHSECIHNFKERENIQLRKAKEAQDLKLYGEVLTDHERNMRENPNGVWGYDGLTYNQRLQKQEKEKQEDERQQLMQQDIEIRRINGIMNSLCVVQMKKELEDRIKTLELENARLKKKATMKEGNTS